MSLSPSTVWPASSSAMACSRRVSYPVDTTAGRDDSRARAAHAKSLELSPLASSFKSLELSPLASRPALRAASGRPPARQPHGGHRGIDLTLQDGGAEATKQIAGAHLGHEPSENSGHTRVGTHPWDPPRAKHPSTVLVEREPGCDLPVGPTRDGTDRAHGRGCQSGRSGKSLVPLA